MNLTAFAAEARRLLNIVYKAKYHSDFDGEIKVVSYRERGNDKEHKFTGRLLWAIDCENHFGTEKFSAAEPEASARACITRLQSEVNVIIQAKRKELDELEQANAKGLKLVESN